MHIALGGELLERVLETTSSMNRIEAMRAITATVSALDGTLFIHRPSMPPAEVVERLARFACSPQPDSRIGRDELFDRAWFCEEVTPDRAREHMRIVCAVLGEFLTTEARDALSVALTPEAMALFGRPRSRTVRPLGAGPSTPPPHQVRPWG